MKKEKEATVKLTAEATKKLEHFLKSHPELKKNHLVSKALIEYMESKGWIAKNGTDRTIKSLGE